MKTQDIQYTLKPEIWGTNDISQYLVISKSYKEEVDIPELIKSIQKCPFTLLQLYNKVSRDNYWCVPLYLPSMHLFNEPFLYSCSATISTTHLLSNMHTIYEYPTIPVMSVAKLIRYLPMSSGSIYHRIKNALYRKIFYSDIQILSPLHYSMTPAEIIMYVDEFLPTDEDKFKYLTPDEQNMFTIISETSETNVLSNSIILK